MSEMTYGEERHFRGVLAQILLQAHAQGMLDVPREDRDLLEKIERGEDDLWALGVREP